jgi:polysaccharide biosynthesis protein PslH
MNILYLSQRLPYPPDRGDRIATFNHIKYLSQRHRVFLAALVQSKSELRQIAHLREITAGVVAERQDTFAAGLGMAISLKNREPFTLGHFQNPKLRAGVDRLLGENRIDAAIAFSSSMAQYLEKHSNIPRIMYFCDMDSQKWADLAQSSGGIKRWVFKREARLLLEYERKIANTFSASCVVAECEAALFRRMIHGVPITVVENGVDAEYFRAVPRMPGGVELTFVGVMNYMPNIEAVIHFVKNTWPRVLSWIPDAHFTIVGSQPTAEVSALGNHQGVRVTGYVDDVRPFLARSSLIIVPLAIARGVQNKILEAMAAGVPVLTTTVVGSNLPSEIVQTIHIAERNPAIFAESILGILRNPEQTEKKAQRAATLVRTLYSWEGKVKQLEELLYQAKQQADCGSKGMQDVRHRRDI